MDQNDDALLTIEDVARISGLSVRTLYNRRARGTGPRGLNLGRSLRFSRADVDAWLAQYVDEGPATA